MKEKSVIRRLVGNLYYFVTGIIKRIYQAILFYTYNGFLTHFPSYCIRTFYLRNVLGIQIGKDTAIHMGCFFAGRNITIGNNTVIARKCYLDGRVGIIEIKNNVSIAPEVCILSLTHDKDSVSFASVPKPVCLEDYTWIGMRAIILPGVVMEKGSVAGAGAVVTKKVEAYTIVGGNPAKVIGQRSNDLNYTLKYFPFFNTDI